MLVLCQQQGTVLMGELFLTYTNVFYTFLVQNLLICLTEIRI